MMRGLLTAFSLLAIAAVLPELTVASSAALASAPTHCSIQRSAYCITFFGEVRLRPTDDHANTEIVVADEVGYRAIRIVEPSRCLEGPADVIPDFPAAAEVRRTEGGWLHFTLRLRRDGSCDLQIAQQVPATEIGTQYDRVMGMQLVICLGESRAANVGGAEMDRAFTRLGMACSLKY